MDKSILTREPRGAGVQYQLSAIMREYAWEKLESTERRVLQQRHRDWYEQLALCAYDGWVGVNQLGWIDRLTREQPNLREAMKFCTNEPGASSPGLRMATALYPFWVSRGLFSEGRHWFDEVLAHQGRHEDSERIAALCPNGVLAALQGDFRSAMESIDEAHGLTDRVGQETKALVSSATGFLLLFSGDAGGVVASFESCLDMFAETDPLPRIAALVGLGMAAVLAGDCERGTSCLEEVIAVTDSQGESVYRSYALSTLGLTYFEQGNLERGAELIEQGLRLAVEVDDPLITATCLEGLAWIAAEAGEAERSAMLMGAAVAAGENAGIPAVVIRDLFGHHDRTMEGAEDMLGRRKFASAYTRGCGLDILDAMASVPYSPRPLSRLWLIPAVSGSISHFPRPRRSQSSRRVSICVRTGTPPQNVRRQERPAVRQRGRACPSAGRLECPSAPCSSVSGLETTLGKTIPVLLWIVCAAGDGSSRRPPPSADMPQRKSRNG
ncbi:hypothetical protein P9990_25580 (plasmid) [Prescottella equi]|uniref:hypothetical protein n=1 Tax=Rhodococcus hoagii TaxID=43767 RepID=UPI0025790F9D|nr:hypothetical protein [Prescottella equi]WJJ14565.1 hypothetical protein P9990_25580 [Prescottella equi]